VSELVAILSESNSLKLTATRPVLRVIEAGNKNSR
jgi:hypothetical protein